MQRFFVKAFILFLLTSIIFLSCSHEIDSLDEIKPFGKNKKYFKAEMVNLHYIIETSDIPKVDTVFKQYISGSSLPIDAKGCKDGVYLGESPYDAFDYKHSVKLEINNEKIISVDYNEVHKESGHGKQEDKVYCEEMDVTGTTPAIAYPIMEKQLLERQDMTKVDAVSGASYSLYRFRYAVTVALMKARLANNG